MGLAITLIFPNQLFKMHPALAKTREIFLIEDFLFFSIQRFHKSRLVLLRAAMKEYARYLEADGHKVHYLEHAQCSSRGAFLKHIDKYSEIHTLDPVDTFLSGDLEKLKMKVTFYPNPMFLLSKEELARYFPHNSSWKMAPFYIQMRKERDLLMENGKPMGGKWSLDAENRKKIPKGLKIPPLKSPRKNAVVQEAEEYVAKNFPDAYGSSQFFQLPVTFQSSLDWLWDFFTHRFSLFGTYEDAIVKQQSYLFHSVLSPLLNIGLLTPQEVVDASILYTQSEKIPLNSLEGFIRQIIGWREFMRAAYELKGSWQRNQSFFKHKRTIPNSFWTGTTGIEPIDCTIQKILDTGYAHHIERLMVLGNFMLLCEFDPHQVYEWFMSLFIDAYDWVMVPNVYGMSQFADGGFFVTKPYFSGSNYLLKMSDYRKEDWCEIWDGLFWRFMKKHRPFFEQNQRMSALTTQLDRDQEARSKKIARAEEFLQNL